MIDALNTLATLSDEVNLKLESLLKVEQFEKDDYILKEGKVSKKMYFLESGLIRGYYLKDGKEITNWFCTEGKFVATMYSFISQNPSYENIQAIEKTTLFSITYVDLHNLYQTYPEFNKIGRLLTEQYFIELEERLISLHFQTAKERYDNFYYKTKVI